MKAFVAGALLLAAASLQAQPHEATRGDLTLRASTVASGMIDKATADRHGIPQDEGTGVLNVLLSRSQGKQLRPIAATVQATASSLSGIRQQIQMREVRENGRVSYLGTYDFLPHEVIDFHVQARPAGAPSRSALALTFRDRIRRR